MDVLQEGDRVRHGGQRWPEAVRYGAGTVIEFVRIGQTDGAHVRMDPNRWVPYSFIGFYPESYLIRATEGG